MLAIFSEDIRLLLPGLVNSVEEWWEYQGGMIKVLHIHKSPFVILILLPRQVLFPYAPQLLLQTCQGAALWLL